LLDVQISEVMQLHARRLGNPNLLKLTALVTESANFGSA